MWRDILIEMNLDYLKQIRSRIDLAFTSIRGYQYYVEKLYQNYNN